MKSFTLSPDGSSLLVTCSDEHSFISALTLAFIECEGESGPNNPLVEESPLSPEQKRAIAYVTIRYGDRQKTFATDGPRCRWEDGRGHFWE